MADLRTLAGGIQFARLGSPVEARQEEVARGVSPPRRGARPQARHPRRRRGAHGHSDEAVRLQSDRPCHRRLCQDVLGRSCRCHCVGPRGGPHPVLPTSAVEAKGMYKQCIWAAWGHAAHRGLARPLLDRRRNLSPMDPGQLATQEANPTRRSSGTTATTTTTLSSSTLAPPIEARAPEAPVPCHTA